MSESEERRKGKWQCGGVGWSGSAWEDGGGSAARWVIRRGERVGWGKPAGREARERRGAPVRAAERRRRRRRRRRRWSRSRRRRRERGDVGPARARRGRPRRRVRVVGFRRRPPPRPRVVPPGPRAVGDVEAVHVVGPRGRDDEGRRRRRLAADRVAAQVGEALEARLDRVAPPPTPRRPNTKHQRRRAPRERRPIHERKRISGGLLLWAFKFGGNRASAPISKLPRGAAAVRGLGPKHTGKGCGEHRARSTRLSRASHARDGLRPRPIRNEQKAEQKRGGFAPIGDRRAATA